MNKFTNGMLMIFLSYIKQKKEDYEKKGFVPTLELLIEDLEEQVNGTVKESVS